VTHGDEWPRNNNAKLALGELKSSEHMRARQHKAIAHVSTLCVPGALHTVANVMNGSAVHTSATRPIDCELSRRHDCDVTHGDDRVATQHAATTLSVSC
jgi:hypothetical protein